MTVSIPQNALIVVADGEHAKMYRNTSSSSVKLEAHGTIKHDSSKGAAATPPETVPREQNEAGFAKNVADAIHKHIQVEDHKAIVLIADPQTLGQIRPSLHKDVTSRIVLELHKTLVNSPVADIEKILLTATS